MNGNVRREFSRLREELNNIAKSYYDSSKNAVKCFQDIFDKLLEVHPPLIKYSTKIKGVYDSLIELNKHIDIRDDIITNMYTNLNQMYDTISICRDRVFKTLNFDTLSTKERYNKDVAYLAHILGYIGLRGEISSTLVQIFQNSMRVGTICGSIKKICSENNIEFLKPNDTKLEKIWKEGTDCGNYNDWKILTKKLNEELYIRPSDLEKYAKDYTEKYVNSSNTGLGVIKELYNTTKQLSAKIETSSTIPGKDRIVPVYETETSGL